MDDWIITVFLTIIFLKTLDLRIQKEYNLYILFFKKSFISSLFSRETKLG